MNLRKRSYFKPLCLLVAVLFTTQCVSFERKLVSTEEKVIQNAGPAYVYELEKIKTPSAQDPIVEYRIVKFPADKVETISTYKLIKTHRSIGFLAGAIIGIYAGTSLGRKKEDIAIPGFLRGVLISSVIVGIGSIIVGGQIKNKSGIRKETTGNYFTKKTGALPMPVQDFPLEFRWSASGKHHISKIQTDEKGIVKMDLIADLKMAQFPLDKPLILYIHYLNPGTQKNALFSDSLGPAP